MKYEELQQLPPILRDFLVYMQTIKGKSSKTVDEYYLDLRTFFRFLKQTRGVVSNEIEFSKIDLTGITIDFIKQTTIDDAYMFLVHCKEDRKNEAASRARKISSIKGFWNFLKTRAKLIDENPMELLETPKVSRPLPRHLTLEHCLKLLEVIDGEYKTRDYFIMMLFLNCGLRLSELCGLNLKDIRQDGTMKVLGKGNKERIVYLNNACLRAHIDYLAHRPVDGVRDSHREALFLSRLKRRMSPKTVQFMVYNYIEKAGLAGHGFSVHKLRHTAATLMYQTGEVDIRVIKDVLGHENLNTTEIYTHVNNKQLEGAAKRNPLNKKIANVKEKIDDK